jgi:hypothetical protein
MPAIDTNKYTDYNKLGDDVRAPQYRVYQQLISH